MENTMTVELSWRVADVPPAYWNATNKELRQLVREGLLIPDTRLRAIADAYSDTAKVVIRGMFPKLAALLDALTKEER